MASDPAQTSGLTTPPRLRMEGISKRFGATVALEDVDLAVAPGQVLALVGENGAGKSTLMKVLSGAHAPDRGRMWLDGEAYRPRHPADARRRGVAMIYQELSLAPHLSVMENVLLGVEPRFGPLIRWSEMRRRTTAALREIGMEDLRPETPLSRLSIAQQQMVEIARALATEARVLVLDEPTSSLTAHDIERLFGLIRRLRSRGLAIVYISHFLEEVREISDRFTVLRDGRTVGAGATAESENGEIITMMVGREVHDLYPRSARSAGEVILDMASLSGREKPLGATLALRRGEVLGIAGLVGAGRTELLRTLFGLDAVTAGEIRVGSYRGCVSTARRWRQGAGMVSENRKEEGLAVGLSIADNITLPKLERLSPWPIVTPGAQAAACRPWIERLPIKCRGPRDPVQSLSGGNQQKVAIARLLFADVDLLLLDEPTRGIDVGAKAQIYRLIDQLARGEPDQGRPGKAILMVSSYLPELLGVCDRIGVMCRGRLVQIRPTDQWDEHQLMTAAVGQE